MLLSPYGFVETRRLTVVGGRLQRMMMMVDLCDGLDMDFVKEKKDEEKGLDAGDSNPCHLHRYVG